MKAAIGVFFLLAVSSLQAQSRPEWEKYGFSKPIRIIRTETERTVNGVRGRRVPLQTVSFDENGNVLTSVVYKPDGSLLRKLGWGHEYDSAGRETRTFYYDDKGVLTNTGIHLYDNRGRRIETTQVNPDGSINHIRSYSYDDKGNNIRESHRNENGSPRILITRKFDEEGRAIEEVYIDAKSALDHRNVMTYDSHGKQTSWTLFQRDGTAAQVRSSFSYDEHGNVKEVITYGPDGLLRSKASFTYELDERGNWIKRASTTELFKDGRSQIESEITYRQLTYF
jgi:hypothetical protein